MSPQRFDTIWTRTFMLLCAAQLLGYAQHFMLAPVLPLYLTKLGGSPFVVGVVLACFAVTSVAVRPIVGHWADQRSESQVMISGLLFQAVSVFFCFIPFIPAAALANGLRGIGWGGLNTGGFFFLALIAPGAKRGAAAGPFSGAAKTGPDPFSPPTPSSLFAFLLRVYLRVSRSSPPLRRRWFYLPTGRLAVNQSDGEFSRRNILRRALHARQRHRQFDDAGAGGRARRSQAARQTDGNFLHRLSAQLRRRLVDHRRRHPCRPLSPHGFSFWRDPSRRDCIRPGLLAQDCI